MATTHSGGSEKAAEGGERRNQWWLLASIAVVAVPVLIGLVLLRGGDDPGAAGGAASPNGDAMGGGMGGDDDPAGQSGIRDFSDIQATDIRFEFDPATGSATLLVDTTLDVACSVVYGPTRAFGALATDADMAGGAHAGHRPRLVGLGPGDYWYRVQGTGTDGTLYQSAAMRFTYPEDGSSSPEVRPSLPNVAEMAEVVEFSSEYSDAYAAEFAIDGDPATEWSSAGDGDAAYIVLDFGENMHFVGVGFRTREMSDGTSITTSFTVTVDGKSYGPFQSGPGMAMALFDASGQKVRIDVETSTGGNTGAVEIEVYGEPEM